MTIKPGMVFTMPSDPWFDHPDKGKEWLVIEEGNYDVVNGKREQLDNHRQNKWYCSPSSKDEPVLCCFDEVFEPERYNFRML